MESSEHQHPPDADRVSSAYVPSFAEVLTAAQAGDGRAFEQLFQALNRRVHAFARVRGAVDPEGLVNDVFLRVFSRLGGFEGGEGQFNAWVFKIARNQMIDESRRNLRRPLEVKSGESDGTHGAASDDTEAEAVSQIGNEALLLELESLTPEQRDVIMLRVVSDLALDTVAEVMGKRVGAVKALQRRALKTLARNLSAEAVSL